MRVAVTVVATGFLFLATSGPLAAGAPGTAWFGLGHPERDAGAFLQDAGLAGMDAFPRFPDDLTELAYCRTNEPCHVGPYPPADAVSFGLVPGFTGSVTLRVTMGGHARDAMTCDIPGSCPVLATGSSSAAPFHLTGVPATGTTGGYVVWVLYS